MKSDFELIAHDLRLAVRGLLRRPAFTFMAVTTLGLSLGVNAGIFSVFNAALLEPLPYQQPERVVDVWSQWQDFDKTWVSIPEFGFYREQVEAFEDVGLYATTEANLEPNGGSPERLAVAALSANLLPVLGVEPASGRGFTYEEARDNDKVAMLGHELWQRRFGGDAAALGSSVTLDGDSWTVIGILPSDFRLPIDYESDVERELFVPLPIDLLASQESLPEMGGSHSYYAMARLGDNATVEQARSELDALAQRNTEAGVYPESWNFRTLLVPVADEVGGAVRPALLALLGAVALVLLIACANVAHLTLVRGQERRSELAVCAALGASRTRLLRQLLIESAMLATASAAIGIAVAHLLLQLLIALDPGSIPRLAEAVIDTRVLAFMVAAALLTLLLSGLYPAIEGSRPNLRRALSQGGRGSGTRSSRGRGFLVAIEMGLAVALLLGAGLLLRSLGNLLDIDPGFETDNVLTARLSLPSSDYSPEEAARFWQQLRHDAEGLPQVVAAGIGRSLPLVDEIGDFGLVVEGWSSPEGDHAKGDWQIVTPGWLEAIGAQRLSGRFFTESDVMASSIEPTDSAEANVVGHVMVINETMARTYWPGADPLGKRVQVGGGDSPWATVIGVVADIRHNGLTGRVKEKFYKPVEQFQQDNPGWGPYSMVVALHTEGDPQTLATPLRELVRNLDPRLPLADVRPLSEVAAGAIARERFVTQGLTVFSLLALFLAAVGISSIVAYTVQLRRREIGLRLALGATPGRVAGQLVRDGFQWVLIGCSGGIVFALFASRLLHSLLYGVGTFDPVTLIATPLLLATVAAVASWLPARAAARLDPMTALREE